MPNPVEIYHNTDRLFRFNPMPQNITFDLSKVGNNVMDIPTYIRPWVFDFTSQSRTLSINATLLSSTRDNSYPGSGTILDQIEDMTYIMSCNWNNGGDEFLRMFVPYPGSLSYTLSNYYTSAGNSDYAQDAASVPGQGSTVEYPSASGVTRTGYDKMYYVYPSTFNVVRDEGSVNRVRISATFIETNFTVKI